MLESPWKGHDRNICKNVILLEMNKKFRECNSFKYFSKILGNAN